MLMISIRVKSESTGWVWLSLERAEMVKENLTIPNFA